MKPKVAVIIGAGPAGLTAAYELLRNGDIKTVVYEMTTTIGGISKTLNYKGNRIDLGGHRFFSKSDIIMQWWQNILPLQGKLSVDDIVLNRDIPLSTEVGAPDPEKCDKVMLVRNRVSRIFFKQKFFDYPISLNFRTFRNLGTVQILRIALSYLKSQILPVKNVDSLEDFLINRFGKELYSIFFQGYTEKVWGVPCSQISSEWGAQRVKGLSIGKAILHAVKNVFSKDNSISQKNSETSLIEQFLYPKLGPGQMWEEVAEIIKARGGEIHMNCRAIAFERKDNRITEIEIKNFITGEIIKKQADYVISTMPVRELIQALGNSVPTEVKQVADGLRYRDFVTVGLLLRNMKLKNDTRTETINGIIPDCWVYIQDKDVMVGRIQIFNNWSPYMVRDKDTVWIGLEYFCNEEDRLWTMPDKEMVELAIRELVKMDIIDKDAVIDSTVIKMPKTYPAYFGTYDRFETIRRFTDQIDNLFLVGRNGMHRYNNADHSMLTAMVAVDAIVNGIKTKDRIWAVNTEEEYHETK